MTYFTKSPEEAAKKVVVFYDIGWVDSHNQRVVSNLMASIAAIRAGGHSWATEVMLPPFTPGWTNTREHWNISGSVQLLFCSQKPNDLMCDGVPPAEAWPDTMCSEVVYDAAGFLFKDGSCGHDKNMPTQLRGNYPCISLCDAEGNKVIIGATGNGIAVTQRKYNQTVLIDPASYEVKSVQTALSPIELSSLTAFTLPENRSRTTIGVGEVVTVSANRPVNWELDSALVEKISETDISLTFQAKDRSGGVSIKAKSGCEEASIQFSIITPQGINFEAREREIINIHTPYAIVHMHMYLYPATVNFGNVHIRELDSLPTQLSGLLDDGKPHLHGKYKGGTSPSWLGDGLKHNALGTAVKAIDKVGGGDNAPVSAPWPLSQAVYSIGFEWRAKGPWIAFPQPVPQSLVIHPNGRIVVSKGNVSETFYMSPKP